MLIRVILVVDTPATHGAGAADTLGLGQMLHLKTTLMVGIIAAAAVEQILIGEGFADIARFVLGLDDLHHLVDYHHQIGPSWGAYHLDRD